MIRIILLFLFLPMLAFSQSNFKAGYLVTNSNDTLTGYIDLKERIKNPRSFIFKSDINETEQTYNLRDCAAYGVIGFEAYERFVVDITTGSHDASRLSLDLDSFKRDTVFLKVLQKGQFLYLYSYEDIIKERFYIKEAGDKEPTELIKKVHLSDDWRKTIVTTNKYVRQLYAAVVKYKRDGEITESKLLNLEYNAKSMLKIVSDINGQKIVKPEYSSSRFFAGLGLVVGRAKYMGEEGIPYNGQVHRATKSMASKSVYSPMLTTGVDWFLNPQIGRLILRAELALLMSRHEITGTAEMVSVGTFTHSFDQLNLAISPQLVYNLYNTEQIKAFFGAGVGFNFSKYTNNKTTRVYNFGHATEVGEEFELRNVYLSIQGTAGVVFNKKIEVILGYSPYSLISHYYFSNVAIQRTRIGVNYLFGKH